MLGENVKAIYQSIQLIYNVEYTFYTPVIRVLRIESIFPNKNLFSMWTFLNADY